MIEFMANIHYGPDTVVNGFDTVYEIVSLDQESRTVTLANVKQYSIRDEHEVKIKLDVKTASNFTWDIDSIKNNRFIWVKRGIDDYFKQASDYDLDIAATRKVAYDLYTAHKDASSLLEILMNYPDKVNKIIEEGNGLDMKSFIFNVRKSRSNIEKALNKLENLIKDK